MSGDYEFTALVRMLSMSLPESQVSSKIFISLLRCLYLAYPDDIRSFDQLGPYIDRHESIAAGDWLESEDILSTQGEGVRLTPTSRGAIAAAASENTILADYLRGGRDTLTTAEANEILLIIVRAHVGLLRVSEPVCHNGAQIA